MSFLDDVKMTYSCPLAWDKLVGGDRKKYCGECDKHVHNLTAMTRLEAQRFLNANQEAPICVRVEVDAMGRSVHRATLELPAFSFPAVGVGVLAVSVAGGPSSCSQETSCQKPPLIEQVVEMGQMAVVPVMGEPAMDTGLELMGDIAFEPEPLQQQELQEVTPQEQMQQQHKLMGRPAYVPED